MRLSIDLHLSLGKPDPEPNEKHDSDHTGQFVDAGETPTGLGFVPPGPKEQQAWDEDDHPEEAAT